MTRRLLNLLTILSLVLCVAVVAAAVVSLWRWDELILGRVNQVAVSSSGGGLEVEWVRRYALRPDYHAAPAGRRPKTFAETSTGRLIVDEGDAVRHELHDEGDAWYGWQYAGRFEWETFDGVNGGLMGASDWTVAHRVAAPHWVAALALAILPAAAGVARHRRRLRRAAGLCPACGYDLRATPGRCPECGAAAAALPILVEPATPRR